MPLYFNRRCNENVENVNFWTQHADQLKLSKSNSQTATARLQSATTTFVAQAIENQVTSNDESSRSVDKKGKSKESISAAVGAGAADLQSSQSTTSTLLTNDEVKKSYKIPKMDYCTLKSVRVSYQTSLQMMLRVSFLLVLMSAVSSRFFANVLLEWLKTGAHCVLLVFYRLILSI
jgi:hypothetical protein